MSTLEVTIFFNGDHTSGGQTLQLPARLPMSEILDRAAKRLLSEEEYTAGNRLCRVFNDRGEEILDSSMISDTDLLYFSQGDDFIPGSGEELARIANSAAASAIEGGVAGSVSHPLPHTPSQVMGNSPSAANVSPSSAGWFSSTLGYAREKLGAIAAQAQAQAPIITEQIRQTAAEQKERFLATDFGKSTAEKFGALSTSAAQIAQEQKEKFLASDLGRSTVDTFGKVSAKVSENATALKTYATTASIKLYVSARQAYASMKEGEALNQAKSVISKSAETIAQEAQKAQQGFVSSISQASSAISSAVGGGAAAASAEPVEGQPNPAHEKGFTRFVTKVQELMEGLWSDELKPMARKLYDQFVQDDKIAGPLEDQAVPAPEPAPAAASTPASAPTPSQGASGQGFAASDNQ